MFQEVGHLSTYEEGYSLLSSIAHGTPPSLVQDYTQPVVTLHSDAFVPMMLVFASRYYLAVVGQWNDIFRLIDPDELEALVGRAAQFFSGEEPPDSSLPDGAT